MKKAINKILLPLIVLMLVFSGCASSSKNAPQGLGTEKSLEINSEIEEETEVTTFFEELKQEEISQEKTEKEDLRKENKNTANLEEKKVAEINNQGLAVNKEKESNLNSKEKQIKIVATSVAVCEIADRLGIELAGVPNTTTSALPSRYNSVKRIGSPMEPDMEILKELNPSDVITPDTLKADLKIKYDNIGVNSTFINLRSVQGLYDSVKLIGDKYGKSKEAEAVVEEYKSFMAEYSKAHTGEKPKVLVLMGLPGSYLVASNNSYAGSLVELAGGVNVFHDSKDFLNINTEEMLAKDPDVIIRTAHGLPQEAIKMFEKEFSTNDIWKHFRAVKNGRVYDVDYKLFGMSAGFDYPQALAELEPMLYGD